MAVNNTNAVVTFLITLMGLITFIGLSSLIRTVCKSLPWPIQAPHEEPYFKTVWLDDVCQISHNL
ncbi:hypothetical protein GCM10007941_14440 [Amphritea balenae]|nr:hypothetical protein GCM10007941_14440 [Amphritea balenae]